MSLSISVQKSSKRTNIKHNNREMSEKEKAKNPHIDYERSNENKYFVKQDLKELYRDEFGDALETYNAKQKRNDRKIENYYEHIKASKKTSLQQELIIQVGDKDDFLRGDREQAKEILEEWFKGFEERNPQFKVYNAVLHDDEATPHMHVNFVPIAEGYQRGLEKQVSFDKAMIQQNPTLDKNRPFDAWRQSEVQVLEKLLNERNIERKLVGKNDYKDVRDYKEKKDLERELRALSRDVKTYREPVKLLTKIDETKKNNLLGTRVSFHKDDYDELKGLVLSSAKTKVKLNKAEAKIDKLESLVDREQNIVQKEQELQARENEVRMREQRQREVNLLLKREEEKNKELTNENTSLRAENKSFREKLIILIDSTSNLKERLRGAYESFTNVVKAVGMLKHSKDVYKADLTEKQADLIDAIGAYGEKWTEREGFDDLSLDIKKHVGISKGIKNELPEQEIKRTPNRNRDRGMEL